MFDSVSFAAWGVAGVGAVTAIGVADAGSFFIEDCSLQYLL
jgi:hypothetical protein